MKPHLRSLLFAVLGVTLSACAGMARPGPASAGGAPVVATQTDASPRFIGLVGPRAQHAPPFLGTPGTNFDCLRSFLDRRTGATVHQLYVADSYSGAKRDWNAARTAAGDPLPFLHISTNEISCEGGCSYAEEFAATIPEKELRSSPEGLAVTFTAHSGDKKTILVSGEQVSAQLAALDAERDIRHDAAAAPRP